MKDCSVDASYIPGYDVQQVCFILCIVFSTLSHLRTYGPLGLVRNEFSTHTCVNVFENADLQKCRDAKDLVLSALIFSFPEKLNQPTINNVGIKMSYSLFGLML